MRPEFTTELRAEERIRGDQCRMQLVRKWDQPCGRGERGTLYHRRYIEKSMFSCNGWHRAVYGYYRFCRFTVTALPQSTERPIPRELLSADFICRAYS